MPRKSKQAEQIDEVEEDAIVDIDANLDNIAAASTETAVVEETPPTYLIELAKSGRADCKKCDAKIENKALRVGVIVEGDWGLFTRWQHLDCTIFHRSLTSVDQIDGYNILSAADKLLVQARFEASKQEVDEDSVPIDPDELVRKSWSQPLEPHSDLLMPLLPYQKEGLGWCVAQEKSEVHGGILADEMGMGKTIQAIALMLHNRPVQGDAAQDQAWAASDAVHAHSSDVHSPLPRAGTLIVLPTVAIRQWQLEIVRFTRENSLSVKVYHGSDRNLGVEDIAKFDVIITSYKVLEIEYRKATAGTKVTCRICGKKFYPDKLRVHRKYFCGETAQRTEAQARTQKKRARVTGAGAVADIFDSDDRDSDESDDNEDNGKGAKGSNKARKAVKGGGNSKRALKDSSDVESEDEITKQKKAIKAALGKESTSKAPQKAKETTAKNKAGKNAKVGPKTSTVVERIDDDSSEDEVAKQKKAIKAAKEKHMKTKSKVAKSSSTMKPKVTKVKPPAKPASRHIESDSSEDEVARQKKAIKAAKEKAEKGRQGKKPAQHAKSISESEESSSDSDSEDDLPRAKGENAATKPRNGNSASADRRAAAGRKTGAKRKRIEDSSSSDDDDSDYLEESGKEPDESDDEALLSEDESEEDIKKAKRKSSAGKKKTSKESVKKKAMSKAKDEVKVGKQGKGQIAKGVKAPSAKGKKGGGGSDSSDESDPGSSGDNDDDSEVERDIAEALKAHSKQIRKTGQNRSLLHEVSWFRIILDEAHLIKDRSTSTAKAVFNLVSLNKWCLTGTPLQNRVGELYSLIRFLRIDPHAYYYCNKKGCDCKSLHYRFTKSMCDDCGHSVIQHYCYFNKHILNPIKRSGYVADGRKAMLKLKQQVLDEVLLRRTKLSRRDDIMLPMRVVRVRQERMDEREEDFYQALYTQSQAQFNTYLQSGTVLNNYAHIFDILIRLRQAVDHPYLVIHSESQSTSQTYSATSTAENDEGGTCDLCKEPADDVRQAQCGHMFCKECIDNYVYTMATASGNNNGGKVKCPECDQALTISLEATGKDTYVPKLKKKSILNKVDLANFQSSTKMEALMEELCAMDEEDVGCKAIVFSQFVNMLDLLEYRIQRGGLNCVKLSGSLSLEQRDKAIKSFREDPKVKVLLISLKAGGVALNLTVANRIFLMDPWWNPAAEMQAIDRTHRIGQFRPIQATRFIIENSIEERILKLQEKKKLVFDGTVGGDAGSMSKLTVDDMRFLFQ